MILSDHMWLSKLGLLRIGLHKLHKFKPNFVSMFNNIQELKTLSYTHIIAPDGKESHCVCLISSVKKNHNVYLIKYLVLGW